jgi:AraC family transcriptional activator of pobA
MADLFAQIDDERSATRPARSIMLRAMAATFVSLLPRERDQAKNVTKARLAPRFQRFLSLIDQHLREGWRLNEFAREIGFSERHLRRICRIVTCRPGIDLIEAAMIREACRLIVYTRDLEASVGYGLGFDDPTCFNRAFRRVMGLSPWAYRAGFEGECGR